MGKWHGPITDADLGGENPDPDGEACSCWRNYVTPSAELAQVDPLCPQHGDKLVPPEASFSDYYEDARPPAGL